MKLIADLHTHTIASTHAYGTILENVAAAKKIGLKFLGITDHGPSLPDSPHEWHFINLRSLPRTIDSVCVLKGIEANIIDFSGNLDLNDNILKHLDIVIAGFHEPNRAPATPKEHTDAYLKVAQNPCVDIIGHSGNKNFSYDYEKVIKAFKEYNKIVEINENSYKARAGSEKNCLEIALLCKKYSVPIILNSDAHFPLDIGNAPKSIEMLDGIDFPKQLIVNSDTDLIEKYILNPKGIKY